MLLEKINTLFNRFFWKPKYEHASINKLCHFDEKPFKNSLAAFDDDEINKSFIKDNKIWYHHEYIYLLVNKCLIEPSNKICVIGLRTLVSESISSNKEHPSLLKYLKYRLSLKKPIKIQKAILFDGTLGLNYFHFFSDVINKIWLLEKYNIDNDIPLIVPQELFEKTYFQFLYNNTALKKRNWIVQDKNMWIETASLYILRPFPYNKVYWEKTVYMVNPLRKEATKNIFLTRSVKAGRYLKNYQSLMPILNKYGFEIVDTENMTFENQVKIFAEAKLIISIHGAGNTNIIFSDWQKVKFIEILPSDRLCCHYYWLTQSLGINYDVVKGGAIDEQNAFELSAALLEKAIQKTLNT